MDHLNSLDDKALSPIRLLVYDVDGVLVARGTRIKQAGSVTTLETKKIADEQIDQMRRLYEEFGFLQDINSGRGLYMLQEMFRKVLPFTSLTYENGSATWHNGKIQQHVNSYAMLKDVYAPLGEVRHSNIKGWEPKENIITIHCHERVPQIEDIVGQFSGLYSIWNGEAYDIGVKGVQTKAAGLNGVMNMHGLNKQQVLAIGDNYNDLEMLNAAGISVTADRSRIPGDYYVELNGARLPAAELMDRIMNVRLKSSKDASRLAEPVAP